MANEAFGDRTHSATPRRREEARRQGQVARSPELSSALILIAAMIALAGLGPTFLGRLAKLQRVLLDGSWIRIESPESAFFTFQKLSSESLLILAPIVLILLAVGVLSNVAQVGVLFTTQTLAPRWSVLDPIQGFGRKFGRRGLVELAKALLKLTIILGVAYLTVSSALDDIVPLLGVDGGTLLTRVGKITVQLGLRVGLALLALAAFDYGYQRWEYEESIKMSRQEIEEEQRQMEGDPQVKARVRVL
ncbi:MAG: EscU/YscU/HrcU family type III secretion system export apparatus switch protein, partial [Candidatus Eisenbacteria bacterium]|nr:EscU/YscU/HrcU family type III secretion system export apparatus switch protein [Candidatus Eisenbacteria bacterium]